jgi:hypothetical protein
MPKFNPEWDIVYLFHKDRHEYCVIKKPEPIPGEKPLMVREGCTVMSDGRWYYWRLLKPVNYKTWMAENRWSDQLSAEPDKVVAARLNSGQPGVIPAPVFKDREDNNWIGGHPLVVPNHLTMEMLDDLACAHLQLCDELQEGKPLQPQAA